MRVAVGMAVGLSRELKPALGFAQAASLDVGMAVGLSRELKPALGFAQAASLDVGMAVGLSRELKHFCINLWHKVACRRNGGGSESRIETQ